MPLQMEKTSSVWWANGTGIVLMWWHPLLGHIGLIKWLPGGKTIMKISVCNRIHRKLQSTVHVPRPVG